MAFWAFPCDNPLALSLIFTFLLTFCRFSPAEARKFECEVCISFLNRFAEQLKDKSSSKKIEDAFKEFCNQAGGKEQRFCYYVGGMPDSATSILGEISKPLSYNMPSEKICEKLDKKDSQICELRYDKSIDWKTVDLNKLRVKDLQNVLHEWGEECKGCTEKSEFVKLVQELKPKHVRAEEL